MILVDTSVWINHLRSSENHLEKLLFDGKVLCHTHIIGELACGNIKNREEIISLLQALPMAPQIEFNEYLYFIDINKLNGRGIGFVDIHLLASAQLGQVKLWTVDKRLRTIADELGLNYQKKK
jgi:predicted nucleic acid-binding protein